MRRATAILTLAAGLAWPAAASADEEIVAAAPNRYQTPEVTIDQGERLVLRNSDPVAPHDVVSADSGEVRNRYRFASEVIRDGETSFVEGSQYLTAGTYAFLCSVHPEQMRGTLTVTSAGAPLPRPGSEPADAVAPAVTVGYGSVRASRLRRTRRLPVTVGTEEPARIVVAARIGARRIGRRSLRLPAAGTRRVAIVLSRRARAAVRRGRVLTVTARATDAAGNTGYASRSVRLR